MPGGDERTNLINSVK